jgi:F-type H+-transporting ATPase subunit b
MTGASYIVGTAYAQTEGETNTAAEVGHGTEAGHGKEGGAFPPFDPTNFASQLLWLAITFGVFYLLMARVVIPRIAGILEVRRDRVSRDLDEAQRLKEESDAAHAAYEHELAEARASAQAIANKANDELRAEAEAERARIEEKLGARLAEAEQRISSIRTRALGEVDRIAGETAATIVQELVGIKASQAEVADAVAAVKGK